MLPGGIADKLGNEYERKWAVRNFLYVVAGTATAIRYETVLAEYHGFEFQLRRVDRWEWHQTKINAPHGNWTLGALNKNGVLDAMKKRLSADSSAKCVFVSQDPSKHMRELCDQARMANDVHEFRDTLSQAAREAFEDVQNIWAVNDADAYSWLCCCEFRTESRQAIESAIVDHGGYLLKGDADFYAILSTYLINNLNSPITTETAREWILENSPFTFRLAALDKTLPDQVNAANLRYLTSYAPFGMGGQSVSRAQALDVLTLLRDVDTPELILLTGPAGTGKSGVVREVMAQLQADSIPHLAFRIDRCLSRETKTEIGSLLLNRNESPVSVLANLAAGRPAVLLIDQIDAVSEVSGRTAAAKDVLFELVREAQCYGDVKCVLVCRTFDLENDPQYRSLDQATKSKMVEVPHLSWDDDVAPVLDHAGFAADNLNEVQRQLLTLPLNLAIFLDIGDPSFNFSNVAALMQGLLEKKTRHLSEGRSVQWNMQEPLSAMATWMSANQELSCPNAVLDPFDGARDLLASEGLITIDQNRAAFFHESFFDFIFGRAFAQSDQDIVVFLTATEQHLFRRTQVRQILTLMRDTDRARYLDSLKAILTRRDIRLHVKLAVAQWLASLLNPTLDELSVILEHADSGKSLLRLIRRVSSWLKNILGHSQRDKPFPVLLQRALFASASWFDLLNNSGELSKLLNTSAQIRQQTLLWWLSRIVNQHPRKIARLLRNYWHADPNWNSQLIDWFGTVRTFPQDPDFAGLLRDVVSAATADDFTDDKFNRMLHQLSSLANHQPRIVSEIVQVLLASWFERHPGRHPFRINSGIKFDIVEFSKLAELAPSVFLEGMIPALVHSVTMSIEDAHAGRMHVLYGTRNGRGPEGLFSLYRTAFQALARTSPADAERRLDTLDPALHVVLLHLHLETISANPSALGHRLSALLGDPRVFSAGMENSEWRSFADAARSVIAASAVPSKLIEDAISCHRPELDLAIAISHESKGIEDTQRLRFRHRVLRWLERSGHVEWCVLKTIGSALLSSRGRKRLDELERKFFHDKVPQPRIYEARRITSTIPDDAISKMTDDQWMSAINAFSNQTRVANHSVDIQFGGALEFARQLEKATKSDPHRFAHFFCNLPVDSHPTFGQHVLQGLANADSVDMKAILAALDAAHAHSNRPFALQFARVIQRHPASAKHDRIFKALLWYAEHGEAEESLVSDSAEDKANEFPSINQLVQTRSSLIVNGINCARGLAWEVLGALVSEHPDRAIDIWTLLERRIQAETNEPVRAVFAYALIPLSRHDSQRFGKCIRSFVEPIDGVRDGITSLVPLSTHVGIHLLRPIERDFPQLAIRLMQRMTKSSDQTLRLLGAWWAMVERLRHGNSKRRFRRIHRRSPAHTALWASILSEVAANTQFRDIAIRELKRLFRHKVREVRNAASSVFQNIPPDEFVYFMDMARAFVQSPAFGASAYSMISTLEDVSCDVTELVLETGERIVRDAGNQGSYSLFAIQQVLKREYVNSETRPDLRSRFLDLIDEMAEKNLPEADDLMRLDDRFPA